MALNGKKRKKASNINMQIDTLLGAQTTIEGDMHFSGGLHIDGVVKGNVIATEDSKSSCHVSEQGRVVGELRVPNININGTIDGDVYSTGLVELAEGARINGNLYYNLVDVSIGAQVNGQLVYCEPGGKADKPKLKEVAAKGNDQKQSA